MEKYHESKGLDMTYARRGVWLVKVPKYLSESWKVAKPGADVGKLRITKKGGSKPDVVFCLNEPVRAQAMESSAAVADPSNISNKVASDIPLEHKFSLIPLGPQKLSVLSTELLPDTCADLDEEPDKGASNVARAEDVVDKKQKVCEGKVAMVGAVIQRAECRPLTDDESYLKLIRCRSKLSNAPVQGIIQIDKTVNNYKPVSAHAHTLAAKQKKKEDGKKTRSDKKVVEDLLYTAFEKHQYYNVKDLVRLTQQPITFLKEILNEICVYNTKASNRNTWELKPEYRHYKQRSSSISGGQQLQQQLNGDDDDDDDDDNLEEVE